MTGFWSALFFSAGYNAALVAIGATMLGAAAGAVGSYLVLRKRSLVSDAMAHATLPGVGLAFIAMVAVGMDGRWLPGLLIGSAVSAGLGLLLVDWLVRRTRLAEDAAIGAVLSVFFGAGVVVLTLVQSLDSGRQAGLEGFLLGSTAGMLRSDAVTIAMGGGVAVGLLLLLRRPFTMVAFDPGFARAAGIDVRRTDLALMGLAMLVTVIGLKIVGLVLIVALLIIPAVAARFWTDRSGVMAAIGAGIGGVSGWVGTALSASAPDLPTGPIIVLVSAGLFTLSLVAAPGRGVLSGVLNRLRFRRAVHHRQGLLAMARGEIVRDGLTLRILRGEGLIRSDGVGTEDGKRMAVLAEQDEARWRVARRLSAAAGQTGRYDGLTPVETVFTGDQIAAFDAEIDRSRGAI
jgi:manganese/zinc/iron transport system permease protein